MGAEILVAQHRGGPSELATSIRGAQDSKQPGRAPLRRTMRPVFDFHHIGPIGRGSSPESSTHARAHPREKDSRAFCYENRRSSSRESCHPVGRAEAAYYSRYNAPRESSGAADGALPDVVTVVVFHMDQPPLTPPLACATG